MCAHLGGTAAKCSISPHLATCILVKVLLHLWDSSVLGILPKPITQRPSITPMRLAVIIISITLPQLAWFTSLDQLCIKRKTWGCLLSPSLFLPNAWNGEERTMFMIKKRIFSDLWFVYKTENKTLQRSQILLNILNISFTFAGNYVHKHYNLEFNAVYMNACIY